MDVSLFTGHALTHKTPPTTKEGGGGGERIENSGDRQTTHEDLGERKNNSKQGKQEEITKKNKHKTEGAGERSRASGKEISPLQSSHRARLGRAPT